LPKPNQILPNIYLNFTQFIQIYPDFPQICLNFAQIGLNFAQIFWGMRPYACISSFMPRYVDIISQIRKTTSCIQYRYFTSSPTAATVALSVTAFSFVFDLFAFAELQWRALLLQEHAFQINNRKFRSISWNAITFKLFHFLFGFFAQELR